MPIRLIGRTTDFRGKTLWEILGNLKDHGVGRLVQRNRFQRYPVPSFFRILRVEPLPDVEGSKKLSEVRKVRAVVEKVFCGVQYPRPVELESQTYKADFQLVPKHEEAALWKSIEQVEVQKRILPSHVEFPPLLKYMLISEMKAKHLPVTEPKLKLKLKRGDQGRNYRLAAEVETPNAPLSETHQPHLYEIPKTT
ncbi:ribosomal protein S34 [Nesidiocoris tenuis]|uniref:Ribosomal protein S34 n=1 Tax=Nesidiocoris tenuis TaxID=355587 RepID=A0ABN7BEV3_9HEMI|nr:ribosomal protein S34 [Nesidiocoris tenuis]